MLIRNQAAKQSPPAAVPPLSKEPLRKLLFICDNMWEERELLPELRAICETVFIDVHPWKLPAARTTDERLRVSEVLDALNAHRTTPFDAVVVYLNSSLLSEELIECIRRNWKCPMLGINLDDKTTYSDCDAFPGSARNYRRWAHAFDCNLSNSRSMVDLYRDEGFPCLYLPTGFHFDPRIHCAEPATSYDRLLSFVGSCKPERRLFIEELAKRGIAVELYGGGWKGAQFTNEGWRIYRGTQLNLGIGFNVPGDQITNLKNRDFECPGAGGCYITTYDWELAGLFHAGREILCYRNVDEFVELYCYYSRRPEACREIAQAGMARARREHTWEQRFRATFTELGFALQALPGAERPSTSS